MLYICIILNINTRPHPNEKTNLFNISFINWHLIAFFFAFSRAKEKGRCRSKRRRAKGMAHIKALKVIEEAGIPIDYIAGTSMGAIVGGLYAIGYTTEQLDSMVRKQDWTFLLSDRIKRSAMSLTDRERSENIQSLSLSPKLPRMLLPEDS